MADPEIVKSTRIAFFQITQAGTDTACAIKRKDVPTAVVDLHLMAPVDQIAGLDGAVSQVNASAESLHLRK